ncbi:hypothetical protein HYFRA_00013738 [Hymenoscyphus fraxineus]|uniref:Uncharacterized protein n=1 Tax=Hymenoscyphus fraxineus TaxID=746836 RepID=A0A9N9Q0A9_9HELO|nr:hypothetical protein HYFRA_00013738 [Hymenoscyphus fraxineus]
MLIAPVFEIGTVLVGRAREAQGGADIDTRNTQRTNPLTQQEPKKSRTTQAPPPHRSPSRVNAPSTLATLELRDPSVPHPCTSPVPLDPSSNPRATKTRAALGPCEAHLAILGPDSQRVTESNAGAARG